MVYRDEITDIRVRLLFPKHIVMEDVLGLVWFGVQVHVHCCLPAVTKNRHICRVWSSSVSEFFSEGRERVEFGEKIKKYTYVLGNDQKIRLELEGTCILQKCHPNFKQT